MKPEEVREHLAKAGSAAPASPMEAATRSAASAEAERDERIYRSISASYFRLRRGMAIVAFAFPIVLAIGAATVELSISAYYHYAGEGSQTYGAGIMRNVFVGVLWAIGTFLYFYKGYSTREDLALDIAGVAAVGVSLLPMDWPRTDSATTIVGTLHYVSAVTFFLAIAFVCLFCSKDTLRLLNDERQKRVFRRRYGILGTLMIVVPATVLIIHWLSPRAERSSWVLLIEVAGIYVFAAFWWFKSREIKVIEDQKGVRIA